MYDHTPNNINLSLSPEEFTRQTEQSVYELFYRRMLTEKVSVAAHSLMIMSICNINNKIGIRDAFTLTKCTINKHVPSYEKMTFEKFTTFLGVEFSDNNYYVTKRWCT